MCVQAVVKLKTQPRPLERFVSGVAGVIDGGCVQVPTPIPNGALGTIARFSRTRGLHQPAQQSASQVEANRTKRSRYCYGSDRSCAATYIFLQLSLSALGYSQHAVHYAPFYPLFNVAFCYGFRNGACSDVYVVRLTILTVIVFLTCF